MVAEGWESLVRDVSCISWIAFVWFLRMIHEIYEATRNEKLTLTVVIRSDPLLSVQICGEDFWRLIVAEG